MLVSAGSQVRDVDSWVDMEIIYRLCLDKNSWSVKLLIIRFEAADSSTAANCPPPTLKTEQTDLAQLENGKLKSGS